VNTTNHDYIIMALDYGNARVGVALGHSIARIPSPYGAVATNDELFDELEKLIRANNVQRLVVGMPYAPKGGDTEQTARVRSFVSQLEKQFSIAINTIDESMSSVEAEKLIGANRVDKATIDAYAAAIILQRYFDEHIEERTHATNDYS
jgi:putative holliday junction resolvase